MDIFYPIDLLADGITYTLFNLSPQSYWGETIHFFIYDVIKIGVLLVAINYLMAVVRWYFPLKTVRKILTKRRWYGLDYLFAATLGVITPFCSCSSIPLFIGFMGAGIPLGVTFAFLIASPLVNEASLYLFPALFGIKVTVVYNSIGMGVAIIGGMIMQRLKLEKYVLPEMFAKKTRKRAKMAHVRKSMTVPHLLQYFWNDGMNITRSIMPYVVVGVGVGALIHGFVPASFVQQYLSGREWYVVPLATLLGAPLYANSVSVIPIMEALVEKGVPLGNALAFMTSVVTLSFPAMMILKKVMRWQLLAWFFGITLTGIIIMGYVLNVV